VKWLWKIVFCLAALVTVSGTVNAKIVGSLRYIEPYSVEGLGVGMPVAPNSRAYKRYKCRPSEQYESSVTCRFSETKGGVSKVITILHLYNNIVIYINKSVSPAVFNKPEIQNEIERLSSRFGRPPRIYASPAGVIGTWGEIELQPLSQNDLEILEQSRDNNPNQGFLVDYLMNFHESARVGLPVYSLGGGKGYIWIAKFEKNGKGALRFLAADPSQMRRINSEAALAHPEPALPSPSNKPTTEEKKPESAEKVSQGTGFFVSSDGYAITNAHVVDGCSAVRVISGLSVQVLSRVVARDAQNDLAILKIETKPEVSAALRTGVRIGESVSAFGFPLAGLLATGGNFTTGNVSAVAGLGNDTRFLQISAPVQPGNSGGPLLDQSGNVVGVVASKLNVLRLATATNDVAQNVNFAIKASVLTNFLEANGGRNQD